MVWACGIVIDFAIWTSPYVGRFSGFGLHYPLTLPLTRKGLANSVAPNVLKEAIYR